VTHLTEHEIQEYLDGAVPDNQARVEEHMATCRGCRMTLDEYRVLYSGLADDSAFKPPAGLSRKVLARIEEKHERRPLPILEDALLLVGVVVSATVGLLWFVDIGSLLQSLSGAGSAAGPLVAPSVLVAAGAVIVITCLLNGFFLRRAPTAKHQS
jgi:predicted anti-sigma-YlaC factor YlaD